MKKEKLRIKEELTKRGLGLQFNADIERIDKQADGSLKATLKDLYEGVAMDEVRKCVVLAARTLIEKDPAYSFVTARLLLDSILAPINSGFAASLARYVEVRRRHPEVRVRMVGQNSAEVVKAVHQVLTKLNLESDAGE